MKELLQEFLTSAEITGVKQLPRMERLHPLARLLEYDENNGWVYYNTKEALRQILNKDKPWLMREKPRLLEGRVFSTSSAMLGEIRTYGNLLAAGHFVCPIQRGSTKTTDFLIKDGTEEIFIEVHSKQYSDEESKALQDFNAISTQKLKPGEWNSRELEVAPFGKPATGENITENAICKLSAIKEDSGQLVSGRPNILWLDLQDELWGLMQKPNSTFPLRSWKGGFQSGEFWYAFYSVRDLPILESASLEERSHNVKSKMPVDGRFRRSDSHSSAVIVALEQHTFMLDNPFLETHLPDWFYTKSPDIRGFSYEYSWINWPDKNLKVRIELEIQRIQALYALGLWNW